VREGKDASVETRALSSASDSGGLSVKICHSRQRHECDLLCLEHGFARFDSAVVWKNKKYYSTLKGHSRNWKMPERELIRNINLLSLYRFC
jgi:hypothetical protein